MDVTQEEHLIREIRRREAYLAEAQRLSHTGSFGWNVSTGEIFWSEETFRIFEYPRTIKPTVGWVLQRVHPQDRARVEGFIDRASTGVTDFDFECRLLMPSGSVKYLHVAAHAGQDESGRVEFVGSVMDISEAKRAEEMLRQDEMELRQLVDVVPQHIFMLEPNGTPLYANRRDLEYSGLTLEEALAPDALARILHPDDLEEMRREQEQAIARGAPWEAEARLRAKDGQYRWFLIRLNPLRDERGGIIRWYGTRTDIEDRKQAEEIRDAQARQAGVRADVSAALSKAGDSGELLQEAAEAIVRHLGAAFARIWMLDKEDDTLKLRASAGMYTHLDGAHSRIPIGKLKIGVIAQEKAPYLSNDVTNDPWVSDRAWARNEGMVSFAGYPLMVQDRVIGVMAMFARRRLSPATLNALASVADSIAQGIERKRAEDALRRAQADLAHVTRVMTLGELTASIAHEVNQPLAAIVANGNACLRWLAADAPNLDEARDAARRIIRDGNRASEVISRIRALVRKTDAEKAPLDINDAIREVVALAQVEVRKAGVALRTELAEGLPSVVGDRVQLQQVILNLMMNGIEAMASVADQPRELLVRSLQQEHKNVLVAVRDSGSGIDSQELHKIFDTFYSTKPHGMGMGLAISRSIIENHGGRLWAVPNDGAGVTLTFALAAGIERPA